MAKRHNKLDFFIPGESITSDRKSDEIKQKIERVKTVLGNMKMFC